MATATRSQIGGFALLNNLDVGVRRSAISLSRASTLPGSSNEHILGSSPDVSSSQPELSQAPSTAEELAKIKAREAARAMSVAESELNRYLTEPMEAGACVEDLVRYWEVCNTKILAFIC